MSPIYTTADFHLTNQTMELTQLTDQQLIDRVNYLGEEILDTSQDDETFHILAARHDAVVEELTRRGMW
ncbi:hypothetical protein STIP28_12 [Synechococcus T7-like virus S-TIP28]|uniref:Uncharacterized protein n=1 Tax=Synechococcus T7-like virus S-TIP28 TaxID=1332140 RepID=A0AAE8XFM9_9CAUD|nr:hypothetical protein STIP28_12 [Synechococcus T7-like virus S-TIP28]